MGITFEIPKALEIGLVSLDNKDLMPITVSLKKVGLHNVTVFENLDRAIDFARNSKNTLLFVDVRSQAQSGLEFLKDLKVDNEAINFPVIPVIKAGEHLHMLPLLREYGVTDVVTMPLQTTNLLQSIARTLSGFLPGELEHQIRTVRAALSVGQLESAASLLQRLSERRKTIRTELGLSHVSLAKNDLERSRLFLKNAHGLDPNSFGVQIAYLRQYLQEKVPLTSLEEAVQIMLPHLTVPGRAGQILKAFYRSGCHSDGLTLSITFEKEFAVDPAFRLWQAKLALKCQRIDTAFQVLQKFHATGQKTFESLNMLGVICKKKRSFDQAVKALTEAQQMSPLDYRIHFNLGMVYEEMADGRRAVKSYERALELSPEFEKAAARLRLLRPRNIA